MMGSIYRPKYKNAAGDLVESAVFWMKYRVNGQVRRESTKTTNERTAIGKLRVKEGDAERGIATPAKVNRKTVDEILAGSWRITASTPRARSRRSRTVSVCTYRQPSGT
jgi:hypothetical protein